MRHAAQVHSRTGRALALALLVLGAGPAAAQIGGKTGADGPFMLEDVEDLDTTAGGVLRAWVAAYVPGESKPLQAVPLTGSGLTLADGQTSQGALRFTMRSYFGFVDYSFGVPVPAVPGASTLLYPSNLTSFTHLTFLVRTSVSLNDRKQEVILETYAGSLLPTLHYSYPISPGTEFQRVTIDLWNPDFIVNLGTSTVGALLSQGRYLSFYFYGGPESSPTTLTAHIDDIQLLSNTSAAADWALY